MLTPEQRAKLESEWNREDQSIASIARLAKTSILALLVLGLVAIGSGERSDGQTAVLASAGVAKTAAR
jgi:hypothetical protein